MKRIGTVVIVILAAILVTVITVRFRGSGTDAGEIQHVDEYYGQSGYSQIIQLGKAEDKEDPSTAEGDTQAAVSENAFSNFVVSKGEYEIVMSSRIRSENIGNVDIFFDGNPLFQCNDGTWFYSLVEDSDTALNPEIALSCDTGKVSIAISEYEITPDAIERNSQASFLIYNDEAYSEYKLVCTTLPVIIMNTDVRTEDIMRAKKEDMRLTVFDNRSGISDKITESLGTVQLRGAHSLEYPQRSFRISLQDENGEKIKSPLLGLRKDDDFILTTTYSDQEKVRAVFTTNLWYNTVADDNCFKLTLGPEYKYVELIMNGDYRGLYGLAYPMDSKQADLKENEYIYKKNKASFNQQTDPNQKGSVVSFEIQDMGNGTVKDVGSNWYPLREYLHMVEESNAEDIYNLVDIENHIDAYLFINLVAGIDNMTKNQIFISKYLGDKRILLTTVWDLDETWGNKYSDSAKHHIGAYEIPSSSACIVENNAATSLLAGKDERIINLIQKQYLRLRADLWSEERIMSLIDEAEIDIFSSGAYARTKERWPDGKYLKSDEIKLDNFRTYVLARLAFMDEYVDNLSY